MKKCPNCSQFFEDDNLFCFNDGTPLVPGSGAHQNRVVISWEENPPTHETRTQVVSHPMPPNASNDNSKFLYTVIGALLAVIVFIGIGFFVLRNANEKDLVQSSNQSESLSSASLSSSPVQNNGQIPANSAKKTDKPLPKIAANSSGNVPEGNFSPSVNSGGGGFRLTRNFNRTFSGTADNDGITMRLQRSGSSLSGKVFSRKSVTEISVSGDIYDDGSFEMSEYSDIGAVTGIYQGRINSDGTMNGTWTKPDGSKPRPFYLRAN